ncbi:unnamed protein product, partial [Ectocarpus sp. 13 AM-2016]
GEVHDQWRELVSFVRPPSGYPDRLRVVCVLRYGHTEHLRGLARCFSSAVDSRAH